MASAAMAAYALAQTVASGRCARPPAAQRLGRDRGRLAEQKDGQCGDEQRPEVDREAPGGCGPKQERTDPPDPCAVLGRQEIVLLQKASARGGMIGHGFPGGLRPDLMLAGRLELRYPPEERVSGEAGVRGSDAVSGSWRMPRLSRYSD